MLIEDGVAMLAREDLRQYGKDAYRFGRSPEARGVGLAVLTLERLAAEAAARAEAAEAKLAEAEREHERERKVWDHAAQRAARAEAAAAAREKALREALERIDCRGMCKTCQGMRRAALAAGKPEP